MALAVPHATSCQRHDSPIVGPAFGNRKYNTVMRISTSSSYAVRALVELAEREAVAPGRPVQLAVLASRRGLPATALEQPFARLRRAGVVSSRRGVRGGYLFARPPHSVTVLDVVDEIDGPPAPARCAGPGCERHEDCGVAGVWTDVRRAVEDVLGGTTIADLVEREEHSDGGGMYFI
jgi:Rrf2 family protein